MKSMQLIHNARRAARTGSLTASGRGQTDVSAAQPDASAALTLGLHRIGWRTLLFLVFMCGGALFQLGLSGTAQAENPPAPPAPLTPIRTARLPQLPVDSQFLFVIEVSHRVFTEFREVHPVRLHELFEIGDGEQTAQVMLFNPDLGITDKGEFLQFSDSLNNPAVKVKVFAKDSLVQESWAFHFTDAPHFRRSDMLGFRLLSYSVPEKFIPVRKEPPAPADSAAVPAGPK